MFLCASSSLICQQILFPYSVFSNVESLFCSLTSQWKSLYFTIIKVYAWFLFKCTWFFLIVSLSHHILNRLFYFCKYKVSNLTLSIQYLLYLIVLTFTELVMCSVFSLDFYHDSLFSPMHTVVLVLPPCNCLSVTLWEWFRNVCKVFPWEKTCVYFCGELWRLIRRK